MALSKEEIEKRVDDSYELPNNVEKAVPNPKVTIRTSTYQHGPYIRECIEGVLMQKTDFPIEFIIGEDCSTDGTREIVFEYSEKYPDIIRVFTADYNVGSKANGRRCINASRGKYMALCEGDDYWTDPLKLQKQVDFLEENRDCSLCFHASKSIRNNNTENYFIHSPKNIPADNKFKMKHAILGGGGFMATNSMVFLREHIAKPPTWMINAPVGDAPLVILLASKGSIGYIDEIMSIYRVMSSSDSWSASMHNHNKRKKHHHAMLQMWSDFDKWSELKYHKYVMRKKAKNKWHHLKGSIIFYLKKFK